MASPYYIQTPDLFGMQAKARQQAQADFASRLGNLYASGDQAAGQALAGVAPDKADAIRSALEKLPGTEQAKVKGRVDLLKKWHFAIANEPDESRRALMWNQMVAQGQAAGADMSHIAPSYSPEALDSQNAELFTLDEAMKITQEKRLQETAQKEGISSQERDFLSMGDATTTQWQDLFAKRYSPKIAMNGAVQTQLIPDATLNKAIAAGMVIPLDWVNEEQAKRVNAARGAPSTVPPERAGALSDASAAAGGLGGSSVRQVVGQKTPEQLQIEKEQRDEARRVADEERALARAKMAKESEAMVKYNQQAAAANTIKAKINMLIAALSKASVAARSGLPTQEGATITSRAKDLMMEFKGDEVYQLGVLNAGDKPAIEAVIGAFGRPTMDTVFLESGLAKLKYARDTIDMRLKAARDKLEAAKAGSEIPDTTQTGAANRNVRRL